MIFEKSSLTIRLALEIDREASVLTLIEALKEQLNSEGHEHGDDLRLYEVEITEIFFIHLFMSSRTYVQLDNLPKKGRIYVQ